MIYNYLSESLILEDRFELIKPTQYKFYGIDGIEVGFNTVDCVGPYIFVFNENLFDLVIETSLVYPKITNELGSLSYRGVGSDLIPVFTPNDGDETFELSDDVIKSEPLVQEFMNSISEELNVNVTLDFSFDISEEDPSYSSKTSFSTLNKDTPTDVFRKLNNVAYILKDYTTNLRKYVVAPVHKMVFGSKFKMFAGSLSYYLDTIEFVGKQDTLKDKRRTRIYNKWFNIAGKLLGNMTDLKLDDIYFSAKYKGTKIS